MLSRAAGLNLESELSEKPFPDVEIESWYAPYIEALKAYGIIQGYEDGYFYPNNNLSRAEAAALIQRSYYQWYN